MSGMDVHGDVFWLDAGLDYKRGQDNEDERTKKRKPRVNGWESDFRLLTHLVPKARALGVAKRDVKREDQNKQQHSTECGWSRLVSNTIDAQVAVLRVRPQDSYGQ